MEGTYAKAISRRGKRPRANSPARLLKFLHSREKQGISTGNREDVRRRSWTAGVLARMEVDACAGNGLPARSQGFASADAGEDARGPSTAAQISNDRPYISFMKCSREQYDPSGSLVNPNGAKIANPAQIR
jgi:hypothetical protein